MITCNTFEENVRFIDCLKDLYNEHISDNDGFLPHVFMGDVARFIRTEFDRVSEAADISMGAVRVLDFLERAASDADPKVLELITVSFLENIADEPSLPRIRSRFGPKLRHMLEDYLSKT